MKKFTVKQLALNGVVAALYAALTILTASFAYGPVQFRLSEALCVLVCFEPTLTVGLTLGCLIANLFSTVSALDIIVGTSATLLACLLTVRIRRAWLVPLPTILCNAIIVGAMLAWVYTPAAFWQGFALDAAEVGAGEAAVLYVLGVPLYLYLKKSNLVSRLLA
jgi:uncharacterized membrane protein